MKEDIKFNIIICVSFAFVIFLGVFIAPKYFQKEIKKILKVEKDLKLISDKINLYYSIYNTYPTSLFEPKFSELIKKISIIDPFDPKKNIYRYKILNHHWIIYSVGPNKIDDGGISQLKNGSTLLDIVLEGRQRTAGETI